MVLNIIRRPFSSESLTLRPLQRRGNRFCKLKCVRFTKPFILKTAVFTQRERPPLLWRGVRGEALGNDVLTEDRSFRVNPVSASLNSKLPLDRGFPTVLSTLTVRFFTRATGRREKPPLLLHLQPSINRERKDVREFNRQI
jgi:hypothetical protein